MPRDDRETSTAARADWRQYRARHPYGGSELTAFEWGFFAGRDYGRANGGDAPNEHDCD